MASNDNHPPEDVIVSLTLRPEDTENVTFIPNTWSELHSSKLITSDTFMTAITMLAERFLSFTEIEFNWFAKNTGIDTREVLENMLLAGMVIAGPEGRYEINPIYVYNPLTGTSMA